MFSAIVSLARRCAHGLLACNSPGQLAAGLALGMTIGLVPKGNLIALSLCVLLFSLRCNKGLAIVAAVLFSCVAAWTNPFAHTVGLWVLSLPSMQASYASIYNVPLGPWLGFNNTVVTGSLLVGLYLAYPWYWITRAIVAAVQRLARAQAKQRLVPQPGATP